ncbi:unnamed protein product [Kuraishia capsulata CBS 1993]|uniref:glucan endo-1,3-beta-D-glucosidase n=1 Tax=Kuraishia capsulata CBS 1993 TaxID=1382522 RepID=W6MTW7_9ASCO|nr:uncharacterized protein KUCA_T00001252001 [Kuraishia capsulata CBS 1993]CDK25285.1 unnamed protein product [Kuraishia capsulata CBS 1993]
MSTFATPATTSGSLFTAIATSSPNFPNKSSPVSIPSGVSSSGPIETNNFYGNILLDDQTSYVYTHPYVVWYSNSSGTEGLAVNYSTASQRVSGPGTTAPVEYFLSPAGNKCLVLGASEFDSSMSLKIDTPKRFSVNAKFASAKYGTMTCPLLQGIGFVTGVYDDLTPVIHSGVGISSVSGGTAPRSGINKYVIKLSNDTTWTMFVTVPSGQSLSFSLDGSSKIVGSNSVSGAVVQICCGTDSSFDSAAGCYPTACTLSGSVSGSKGTYALSYTTSGTSNSGKTLMFALPHQVDSFTSTTSGSKTSAELTDTVHGTVVGYLTKKFEMSETLPTSMSLAPFTTISGWSKPNYTSAQLSAIKTAAEADANDDVASLSNLDSMYYSGKILDKFAYVLYTIYYVLEDESLAKTFLAKMKTAMERFTGNNQTYPLAYDTTWKGIVSEAGLSGDSGADFGNTYYNDHHFHYGYHVHAAAIIAKVDKDLGGSWLSDNKDWVNALVRDYANPNDSDSYFPVFRNFDFFIGHSFAHGITVYADGKDEESSSEDYNSIYAMKIWGDVIGDTNMVNRANLILSIMRRSIGTYMLYKDDNSVEPSNFIGNKCSGIKFENKIDHTTYFGTNEEYIHGIHMLPITPVSSWIRDPTFVKQEWEEKLSSLIDSVSSGWKGVLMLNVALYDPQEAYSFFSGSSFSSDYLDDGQTKTWCLVYSAGVMS